MVIFDTNIWVSYTLFRSSPVGRTVTQAIQCHSYAFSAETMRELTDVTMRSKFDRYLRREIRLHIIKSIATDAAWFDPTERVNDCRDPKDNMFLELAIASQADFLITGDKDLLVLDPFRKTRILTLTDFAEHHLSDA